MRFSRPAFPQFRPNLGMSVSGRDLPLVAARSGTERARSKARVVSGLTLNRQGMDWAGIVSALTIKCQGIVTLRKRHPREGVRRDNSVVLLSMNC